MLSLPSAGAYQHNSDCCVSYETIPYVLANCFGAEVVIVYISVLDRFVDNIVAHHLDEPVFICLILMVVADKHPDRLGA